MQGGKRRKGRVGARRSCRRNALRIATSRTPGRSPGLREEQCLCSGPGAFPCDAQWRFAGVFLAYRCGGSAGLRRQQ